MSRRTMGIIVLLVTQAALIVFYLMVERDRGVAELGTAPPIEVNAALPPLPVRMRDGSIAALPMPKRPTLLHFWATWCPPCREELPDMLELPNRIPVDVHTIALDRNWNDVDRFLGRSNLTGVFLAETQYVERVLGVASLPVTFLVDGEGRILLRFDGARDWSDDDFVRRYIAANDDNR